MGIGHPYPQTIDALTEYLPKIEKKVEFIKIIGGHFELKMVAGKLPERGLSWDL